ncbi:MAG: hypothetical protein D6754_09135 [Alphaproteobacteria bacterium]|nr:MAG: hypothetical protein D6754_09135 [Alphaproteobacteria bacterium]
MARKSKKPAAPAWQPDDATPRDRHRLAGLEPDNLLAFMALLGLLRALEHARPDWRPRAFWDVETQPWRPVLTLAQPATEAEVARAAKEGVEKSCAHHAATGEAKDLKFSSEEFLGLRNAAATEGRAVLDALCCPSALRDDRTLWPTPFAFMFGQGHQHFLERFRNTPAQGAKMGCVARALFIPWQRQDNADGFRWDPAEDRRYALRAINPSGDKITTELGANVLAAISLPLFPVYAVRRGGQMRVLAPMNRFGANGRIEFTWPLWTRAASLRTIRALLQHPELAADHPNPANIPHSAVVLRAQRISVGKYFNVTPAAPPA